MLRNADGAICVFEGVVRDRSKGKRTLYLEYEAYESMALKKIEEIGVFVRQAWEIGTVAIIHRLGHMDIGETSVAVIVNAMCEMGRWNSRATAGITKIRMKKSKASSAHPRKLARIVCAASDEVIARTGSAAAAGESMACDV